MRYTELVDFIENRMSMEHIYQPLLIRTLIDTGGSVTVRQLAQAVLSQDESQLLYSHEETGRLIVRASDGHRSGSGGGD